MASLQLIASAVQRPCVLDYEPIRRIGRGSYGEVWLVRTVLGEYRALKIVHRAALGSDRPYEREFEGIRKFEPISRSHPSQVSILHVGRGQDYFYYVMQLADRVIRGFFVFLCLCGSHCRSSSWGQQDRFNHG